MITVCRSLNTKKEIFYCHQCWWQDPMPIHPGIDVKKANELKKGSRCKRCERVLNPEEAV